MEIINTELRIVLGVYADGLVDLAALKEWLAVKIWELVDSPSPLDRMTVGELQIAMSEFDRGDRDEGHVKTVSEGLVFILKAVQRALSSPEEVMKTSEASLVGLQL